MCMINVFTRIKSINTHFGNFYHEEDEFLTFGWKNSPFPSPKINYIIYIKKKKCFASGKTKRNRGLTY